MEAVAEDLKTGEKVAIDLSEDNYENLKTLAEDKVTDARLQSFIDNLDLSADGKALISSILEKAIKVGEMVIRIGKRIVELVIMIANKYPKASFGLALGLLVGALIASIPIMGALLGAFVTPIAAAFGLMQGFSEDLKDQGLSRKIAEATAMFQPLNGEVHVAS